MFDIIGKRFWFFLISAVVIIPGIIFLAIFGLRPGIDFTSGSTMTLSFEETVDQGDLREALAELGQSDAVIQYTTGEGNFFIRVKEIGEGGKEQIVDGLEERFGPLTVLDFYSVSPVVAQELVRYAAIAVAAAAVGILLYISWAFRKMPAPFRYGTCAIIALVHDVLVVLGIFSILGVFLNMEVNAMFITGVLTIIGYSVNDTIVVFDRIRENITKGISRDFEVIVNSSLIETLGRSLNTSLTTLFVLLALFLFGGATIQNFILVLLIGIISGTYSSIGVASSLLVVWEKGEWGRFIRWLPLPRAADGG